ncbi:MAG: 4'-phosphopantetheinyl transferase superfamily protein [Candidatus Competibacteraceae bacterium]|nr:4'-phosphopantetheinyl transferase superfamily protein [Candidatus Competibacteraceae bacterium]
MPGAGEVQVWRASLRQPPERLLRLAATLSPDERERAARFRFPEHRERFSAGRGMLRVLLGHYLDRPAASLRFEQGAHGKPALAGARGAGLHFNVSHSEEGVLYAISRREVGADLECHARTLRYEAIVDRICTARELAHFQNQAPEDRRPLFFACWTRKEAMAKALGGGLASGFRTLEVGFGDGLEPEGRIALRDAEGRDWSVLNLPLETGWSGALAGVGLDWRWSGRRLQNGSETGD